MTTQRRSHPYWSLAALLGGMCLGNVDIAIANIAGPSIQSGLHTSGSVLELVVSGYTVAYAMLLITSARLGEIRGYRSMFLLGLTIFTLSSLACGLAPSALLLVLARLIQGGAAALMIAQVLTGIQLNFDGAARARALGLYAAVLAGSAVAGQILGGVLVSANLFGTAWRPVFLINVPLGVLLFAAARRALPASQPHGRQRLDMAGVLILSAAILLLLLPLILGRDLGWPAWTWLSLGLSLPVLAGFVMQQRRAAGLGAHPVLNLPLLTRPAIAWALSSQAMATATYFAILFVLALYLQKGLGASPAYSGMALVSWVAAFGVAGPVLGRLPGSRKRLAAAVGAAIMALAFAGIAASLLAGNTSGAGLMTLLGLAGFGLGTNFSGTLDHLTSVTPTRYAPDISGLFNTTSRIGGVIGVAVFGTAYLAIAPGTGRSAAVTAFTALTLAFAGTALIATVMACLAARRRALTAGFTPAETRAPPLVETH
jgi:MFS family permease